MTINSEIKEKLRKADLEHHRKLKRQETIQFIKGGLAVFIFVAVMMSMSFILK
jgi:hypothetical protein